MKKHRTMTNKLTMTLVIGAVAALPLLAACATAELSYPPVQPPAEGGSGCPIPLDDAGDCVIDSGLRLDAAGDARTEAGADAAADGAADSPVEAASDAGAG